MGTGATPSCLSFGNAQTGERVAEYITAHVDPKALAPIAVALCWLFKAQNGEPARMAWEIPGPGVSFGGRVIELGFRNVYLHSMKLPHTLKQVISG